MLIAFIFKPIAITRNEAGVGIPLLTIVGVLCIYNFQPLALALSDDNTPNLQDLLKFLKENEKDLDEEQCEPRDDSCLPPILEQGEQCERRDDSCRPRILEPGGLVIEEKETSESEDVGESVDKLLENIQSLSKSVGNRRD